MNDLLKRMRGGLIVSCQASPGSPLRDPCIMSAMAQAAQQGGAVAIRAQGVEDIEAIAARCTLPLVGLIKHDYDDSSVYITATLDDADRVVQAGAHIVALDGTARPRPQGQELADIVGRLHNRRDVLVMADVDSTESARYAVAAGADMVSTTLAGYTPVTSTDGPDIDLVERLSQELPIPVIAEGRYATPTQVRSAFAVGAYAVVVGTAITDPIAITARLVTATPALATPPAQPQTRPRPR